MTDVKELATTYVGAHNEMHLRTQALAQAKRDVNDAEETLERAGDALLDTVGANIPKRAIHVGSLSVIVEWTADPQSGKVTVIGEDGELR